MDCVDITELTPLYLAGDLEAGRAVEFDAHLKICSSCFRELETQARLDARLREVLLSEDVDVVRVNRRIRELLAHESLASAVKRVGTPRRRWVTAAMGIAAVLLLALAGYLLAPGHVSKVYADAAEDHQAEVIEHAPRRWLTDPSEIAAVAQREGIDVGIPAVLASGYHLERAKICGLDGLAYLHLVYTDGTREFSLFLRSRSEDSSPGGAEKLDAPIRGFANGRLLRGCTSGDEHLSSFTTSHLRAVVATDGSASASLEDAELASDALQD